MKIFNKTVFGNKTIISFLGIKFKIKNKKDIFLEEILKNWETNNDPISFEKYLSNIIKKGIEYKDRDVFLVYISTLLENGKIDEAEKHLFNYIDHYELSDLFSFPFICSFALGLGVNDENIIKIGRIFDLLEENKKNFLLEKMVKNKNVAIVGNSPNLIGTNKGYLIDKHDFVVRFNNFQTEGFEKDYGSKTNIWVCCQANDIINRPDEEIKNLKFILYNVDLKHTKLREKCLSNIMKNILLNSNISYIGAENKKGLKDFGIVYPSTGLSTICCFRKYTNLLRNNIFGFSFLNNDNNFYDHYFAKRSNKTIKRFLKNCHHNFDCESFYLNEQFKD